MIWLLVIWLYLSGIIVVDARYEEWRYVTFKDALALILWPLVVTAGVIKRLWNVWVIR